MLSCVNIYLIETRVTLNLCLLMGLTFYVMLLHVFEYDEHDMRKRIKLDLMLM